MMSVLRKISLPLLFAAVSALAWAGVSFSPGFSEGFSFSFIAAMIVSLLMQNLFGRLVGVVGALLLTAGSYIYAAGDDHLDLCFNAALAGGLICAAVLVLMRKKWELSLTEGLLKCALLFAGIFTLFCGIFSTALLPLGLGVIFCLASRFFERGRAQARILLPGLLLCAVFLIAPMCFPGGV